LVDVIQIFSLDKLTYDVSASHRQSQKYNRHKRKKNEKKKAHKHHIQQYRKLS